MNSIKQQWQIWRQQADLDYTIGTKMTRNRKKKDIVIEKDLRSLVKKTKEKLIREKYDNSMDELLEKGIDPDDVCDYIDTETGEII